MIELTIKNYSLRTKICFYPEVVSHIIDYTRWVEINFKNGKNVDAIAITYDELKEKIWPSPCVNYDELAPF